MSVSETWDPRRGVGGGRLSMVDGVAVGLVAVLAGAAGFGFQQVFGDASLVRLVVLPAAGSVMLAVLLSRVVGLPAIESAVIGVLVGAVVATAVAWQEVPTPALVWEALQAVRSAPTRILDVERPAPDRPEMLVLVAATTWLVGYAGADLVLRVRSVVGALLLAVAGLTGATMLAGAEHAETGSALVLVVALAAGGLLLLRRTVVGGPGAATRPTGAGGGRDPHAGHAAAGAEGHGRSAVRKHQRRRVIMAVPLVVIAAVVPVALGDHLPLASGDPRFDLPEETVGERQDERNPLTRVTVQRSADETDVVFTAQAPEGIDLWRTVTLDTFDGVEWTSSGTFVPVGTFLPAPGAGEDDDVGGSGASEPADEPEPLPASRQEISLTGADESRLLPVAAGAPQEVHDVDADLSFDANGATLQIEEEGDADREETVAGLTYAVETVLVDPAGPEMDQVRRDRSGADAEAAAEPIPEAGLLSSIAMDQVTARRPSLEGSNDSRELQALQDFFADQGRFHLASEPEYGLTLGQLSTFVETAVAGGPSEGTVEQYATAFAVMARTLGYPTRVAVGYRTPAGGTDGTYEVTNRDAFAWAEVKLEDLGWVPFVVGPVRTDDEPPDIAEPETTTTVPEETEETEGPVDTADSGISDDSPEQEATGSSGLVWWQVALFLVPALIVLGVLLPAFVRMVRYRRHARHGDPRVRVDGSWRFTLDRLAAHRVPVTRAMTAAEVLATLERYFGAAPPATARELASLSNQARFAVAAPRAERGGEAWQLARRTLAWARGHSSWRDRLRAWFRLRP